MKSVNPRKGKPKSFDSRINFALTPGDRAALESLAEGTSRVLCRYVSIADVIRRLIAAGLKKAQANLAKMLEDLPDGERQRMVENAGEVTLPPTGDDEGPGDMADGPAGEQGASNGTTTEAEEVAFGGEGDEPVDFTRGDGR